MKRSTKKALAFTLALCMVLTMAPAVVWADVDGSGGNESLPGRQIEQTNQQEQGGNGQNNTGSGIETSDGQSGSSVVPETEADKGISSTDPTEPSDGNIITTTTLSDSMTMSLGEYEYKVEHYLQNLNGSWDTTASETMTGSGPEYTTVYAVDVQKNYDGFTYDSTIVGSKASGQIDQSGNLTLKLYYTRDTYQLQYQNLGGDYVDQMVSYGAVVVVPDALKNLQREGYTFEGWFKMPGKITYATMPAFDVTYVQLWTGNPYTVNYDGNDADSGSMTGSNHVYGEYVISCLGKFHYVVRNLE